MKFTLSREWKTFSCSNTSKNAVQIYCYKEQFLSFCRVEPCGFSRCSDRRFFSGKWCKDKSTFLNHQIFSKEFFQKFSEPFFLSFRTVFLIRSGCKGKSFFRISKRFWNFFQNFSERVFGRFRVVFLSQSGCKDKGIPELFPNNSGTFFRQFRHPFCTPLSVRQLVVKIF